MMCNFLKTKKLLSLVLALAFGSTMCFPTIAASAKAESKTNESSKLRKSQNKNAGNTVREVPNTSQSNQVKPNNPAWSSKKQGAQYRAGELIVKFKEAANPKAAKFDEEAKKVLNDILSKDKITVSSIKNLGFTNAKLVKLNTNKTPEEVAKLLAKHSALIEYAEPNYIIYASDISPSWVPTDPYYQNLWGLRNVGQTIGGQTGIAGIDLNAQVAWDTTRGSSSVVVAVIDTGVDYNHPDLKNNMWVNTKEIAGNGKDDDGNGYIDDVRGWNFYWYNNNPYDDHGHGTHVAGTIAASTNSTGVIGVAPNVKIMPLKFLGSDGSGYTSDAVLAVDYARKMNVKISNNSWGGGGYSQALYDSIKNSGSLFVAAAGNSGINTDTSPHYPSSYNLSNILSVAAIDNRGSLGWFSNYGVNSVDVAAAGVNVYSTKPGSSYQYLSGTSMATPHVAGVAALVLSRNSSITPLSIKDTITKSVVKLSTLQYKIGTGGMVNAAAAIGAIPDDDIPGITLSGSTVSGSLNMYTDIDDVYNVSLVKGDVITITLSGAAGTDFDLYLYNKTATTVKTNAGILAYSEKVGTSTEKIIYSIQQDGTYFIDVYSFTGTGTYTLNFQKGLKAGSYEDNSGIIPNDGNWLKVNDVYSSGGSYTTGNSSGSILTLKFTGTGVQLTSLKNNKQGIIKITVDSSVYYVDLYSSTTYYKAAVFTKTGLTSGTHTLKIEWTGKPSRNARKATGGTMINIDKLTIY
ncbi:hypothetical protein CPJCM30710_14400 [Clostridium polyendosporum]|uniref:Serine protease, subtilisin family n=1 Tax=Clostridium polyendosporum TaxID=69208 RepID=A0A919RZQ3_9CLOT|nr:S8 family serine peptidase [Clostridium polyendosporum]GIM28774.1 hypothetical protein CPJCM30710_14400 [Clostridium polyendosporum]